MCHYITYISYIRRNMSASDHSLVGNGRYIFQISNPACESPEDTPEYKCNSWRLTELARLGDAISKFVLLLPACPPQYALERQDARFLFNSTTGCATTIYPSSNFGVVQVGGVWKLMFTFRRSVLRIS